MLVPHWFTPYTPTPLKLAAMQPSNFTAAPTASLCRDECWLAQPAANDDCCGAGADGQNDRCMCVRGNSNSCTPGRLAGGSTAIGYMHFTLRLFAAVCVHTRRMMSLMQRLDRKQLCAYPQLPGECFNVYVAQNICMRSHIIEFPCVCESVAFETSCNCLHTKYPTFNGALLYNLPLFIFLPEGLAGLVPFSALPALLGKHSI